MDLVVEAAKSRDLPVFFGGICGAGYTDVEGGMGRSRRDPGSKVEMYSQGTEFPGGEGEREWVAQNVTPKRPGLEVLRWGKRRGLRVLSNLCERRGIDGDAVPGTSKGGVLAGRGRTPGGPGKPCGALHGKGAAVCATGADPRSSGWKISMRSAITSLCMTRRGRDCKDKSLAGDASGEIAGSAGGRAHDQPCAHRGDGKRPALPVLPEHPGIAGRVHSDVGGPDVPGFNVATHGVTDEETANDSRPERHYRPARARSGGTARLFDSIQEGLFFATAGSGSSLDVNDAMVRNAGV